MKTCIFVGPTAADVKFDSRIDRFGPAALGSIFQAVEMGYSRIGLVDGIFGNCPSVWHKEILYAISNDVRVFGSSSMGALRAAELHQYGMIGVGKIFRLYRAGVLNDDDEVCLSHAVEELRFLPLTIPMINARITARMLIRKYLVTKAEGMDITIQFKKLNFWERTTQNFTKTRSGGICDSRTKMIIDLFSRNYVNQKVLDYVRLLELISATDVDFKTTDLKWSTIVTRKWLPQFKDGLGDLPQLKLW